MSELLPNDVDVSVEQNVSLHMKDLFYSLKPKHWIKNFFIFLPLIFGKKLFVFPINLKALVAFFLFCLTAGVVYLINDIMDLEKDKLHPIKRLRPIASGKVSIKQAQIVAFVLGILSLALSFMLNVYFGWVIVTYLIFNFIYTKILKEIVIIDVFCIAGFLVLRIVAGSAVTGIRLSHWIIMMTACLALFLGFSKRRQELKLLGRKATSHRYTLAKYSLYFIDQMSAVISSLILIIYTLYTVDVRTVNEFGTRHLLYSVPFVYYGIFRYLYLVHKLHKGGDPISILFSDKEMQINLFLWIFVCILVIFLGL